MAPAFEHLRRNATTVATRAVLLVAMACLIAMGCDRTEYRARALHQRILSGEFRELLRSEVQLRGETFRVMWSEEGLYCTAPDSLRYVGWILPMNQSGSSFEFVDAELEWVKDAIHRYADRHNHSTDHAHSDLLSRFAEVVREFKDAKVGVVDCTSSGDVLVYLTNRHVLANAKPAAWIRTEVIQEWQDWYYYVLSEPRDFGG